PVGVTVGATGAVTAGVGGPVLAHELFAPIHTATTRTAPMPTVHRNRPSLTGPIRPSARPPGFGSVRSVSMYLITSRFWSAVIVLLLNTGMFSGPVIMASQICLEVDIRRDGA